MDYLFVSLTTAFSMITTLNEDVLSAVGISLYTSLVAILISSLIGIPLGTLYVRRLRGRPAMSLWSGRSQFRRDMSVYEYKPRKERVIEREVLLKQKIPLECDNCGAPINPEQLDWIGSDTIKCPNCGTSLRVETERI